MHTWICWHQHWCIVKKNWKSFWNIIQEYMEMCGRISMHTADERFKLYLTPKRWTCYLKAQCLVTHTRGALAAWTARVWSWSKHMCCDVSGPHMISTIKLWRQNKNCKFPMHSAFQPTFFLSLPPFLWSKDHVGCPAIINTPLSSTKSSPQCSLWKYSRVRFSLCTKAMQSCGFRLWHWTLGVVGKELVVMRRGFYIKPRRVNVSRFATAVSRKMF